MFFIIAYVLIGLVSGRVARNQINWRGETQREIHNSVCDYYRGRGSCDHYVGCPSSSKVVNFWLSVMLFTTFLFWPVALLATFLLAERVTPNIAVTRQQKLDRLIAQNDAWVKRNENTMKELGLTTSVR